MVDVIDSEEHEASAVRALTARESADLGVYVQRWWCFLVRESNRWARIGRLCAEELLANILAVLVARFPTFDEQRGQFSTWASLICKWCACRMIARRKRTVATTSVQVLRDSGENAGLHEFAADERADDAHALAEQSEAVQRVKAAVVKLPPRQRLEIASRHLGEHQGKERRCSEAYGEAIATLRAELAGVSE